MKRTSRRMVKLLQRARQAFAGVWRFTKHPFVYIPLTPFLVIAGAWVLDAPIEWWASSIVRLSTMTYKVPVWALFVLLFASASVHLTAWMVMRLRRCRKPWWSQLPTETTEAGGYWWEWVWGEFNGDPVLNDLELRCGRCNGVVTRTVDSFANAEWVCDACRHPIAALCDTKWTAAVRNVVATLEVYVRKEADECGKPRPRRLTFVPRRPKGVHSHNSFSDW